MKKLTAHLLIAAMAVGVMGFSVASAAPTLTTNLSVRPKTFYPIVHDGHRDYVTIRYKSNLMAHHVLRIKKGSGGVILTRDFGNKKGAHTWGWWGKNDEGNVVKPGAYRAVLRSQAGNKTRKHTVWVRVKTATVTRSTTITKRGNHESSRRKSGNCHFFQSSYYNELTLDCWGGNYAQARYGFHIKPNAFDIRWGERGSVHCCSPGHIYRNASRYGDLVRVTITATNWRQYVIKKVWVAYRYRKQI